MCSLSRFLYVLSLRRRDVCALSLVFSLSCDAGRERRDKAQLQRDEEGHVSVVCVCVCMCVCVYVCV